MNKPAPSLTIFLGVFLLILCAIGSFTYLTINNAYNESIEFSRSELDDLEERNNTETDSANEDTVEDEMPTFRELMVEKLDGGFDWSIAETSFYSEISCSDGEKVDPNNKFVSMEFQGNIDIDLAFDHVAATAEMENYDECNSQSGAHAVNKTFRKDGLLLNYFYVLPTAGQPESALKVSFEYSEE